MAQYTLNCELSRTRSGKCHSDCVSLPPTDKQPPPTPNTCNQGPLPLQGELLTLKSGRVEASYFTLKTNTIACSIQDILRSEVLHVFLTLLVVMVVSLLLFFGNCNFAVMNCRINNLIYRLSHV